MNTSFFVKNQGFTLLEVMVALAIFAICAATLVQQSSRSTRQALELELRMKANWIAENELEKLRLAGYPPKGKNAREIMFAKQRWQIESDVTDTNNPDLRKVIVVVLPSTDAMQDGDMSGYRLTGFLGRY